MTCGHCVGSVSAQLGAVPGVSEVDVDLAPGQVRTPSDQPDRRAGPRRR
ncbi:MAG: heavy-metal-associated domain-containing protein [Ornithinimicrobium sp.]